MVIDNNPYKYFNAASLQEVNTADLTGSLKHNFLQ